MTLNDRMDWGQLFILSSKIDASLWWNINIWDALPHTSMRLLRESLSRKCFHSYPCLNTRTFCIRNHIFPKSKETSDYYFFLKTELLHLIKNISPCNHHFSGSAVQEGQGREKRTWVKSQFLQSRAMYKLLQNHRRLYFRDLVYQQSSWKHTLCAKHWYESFHLILGITWDKGREERRKGVKTRKGEKTDRHQLWFLLSLVMK